VQEDIHSMEPGGPHGVEHAVPTKREDGQGTKGFVGLGISEGKSPEVIGEYIREGCVTPASNN
jgi:hypothetical protein